MPLCPHCGQENPLGLSFRGACGADLGSAPRPAREERPDRDDVGRVPASYQGRLRTELEQFGGMLQAAASVAGIPAGETTFGATERALAFWCPRGAVRYVGMAERLPAVRV